MKCQKRKEKRKRSEDRAPVEERKKAKRIQR